MGLTAVPVVQVEGRTHPVEAFFLEDALEWVNFGVPEQWDIGHVVF